MKTLLIVFHSRTGGTRQMAEAAFRGAASEVGIYARLSHAPDAGPADVLAADGYIFATPENLAAIAGLIKDFFDRTYYPALERSNGRPYATLVCAGSDGHNAARQITRIATGWRLRPVAEPLIVCTHAQTPEAIQAPKIIGRDNLARCAELGAALAAGMAMGILTRDGVESDRQLKCSGAFHHEPKLRPKDRAELADYARSGYDRGHMSPSGEMATPKARYRSFSLANMIPQNPCNNEVLWEGIESAVRDLASAEGEIYVVTRPIYEGKDIPFLDGRAGVPSRIYKAMHDPAHHAAAAYVTPNADGMDWQGISINELA